MYRFEKMFDRPVGVRPFKGNFAEIPKRALPVRSPFALAGVSNAPVFSPQASLLFGAVSADTTLFDAVNSCISAKASDTMMRRIFLLGRNKKLDSALEMMNEVLLREGTTYKVTRENLYSPRTVEAILELHAEGLEPQVQLKSIAKIVQKLTPAQETSLREVYIQKGLCHPNEEIREHYIKRFIKERGNRDLYQPLMRQMARETNLRLASMMEAQILSLATEEDVIEFTAGLVVNDSKMRQLCIKGLTRFSDASTVKLLVSVMETESNPQLLSQLQEAILMHARKSDNELFIQKLQSPNPVLRKTALTVLGESKDSGLFQFLFENYQQCKDPELETVYKSVLSKLVKADHATLLLGGLREETERLQSISLTLLEPLKTDSLIEPLFRYLEAPGCHYPNRAIDLLVKLQNKIPADELMSRFYHPNPRVRQMAIHGLTRLERESDLPLFVKALSNEADPEIAGILAQAIKACGEGEDKFSYIAALLNESQPPAIRSAAAQALTLHGILGAEVLFSTYEKVSRLIQGNEAQTEWPNDFDKTLEIVLLETLETLQKHAYSRTAKKQYSFVIPASDYPVLFRMLNGTSELVQSKVLSFFARDNNADIVPHLVSYLESERCHSPAQAMEIIGRLRNPDHAGLFLEKLFSPQRAVRQLSAEGLKEYAREADLPTLFKAVAAEENLAIDKLLLGIIKKCAKEKSAFHLLHESLMGNTHEQARSAAAHALTGHGLKALTPLLEALTKTDDKTTLSLLKDYESAILELSKQEDALPILLAKLHAKHEAVQRVAGVALSYFAEKWAKESPDKEPYYDNADIMGHLTEFIASENPVLKESADKTLKVLVAQKVKRIQSLGSRGSASKAENFQVLESLKKAPYPEIQEAAAEALAKLEAKKSTKPKRRRRYPYY